MSALDLVKHRFIEWITRHLSYWCRIFAQNEAANNKTILVSTPRDFLPFKSHFEAMSRNQDTQASAWSQRPRIHGLVSSDSLWRKATEARVSHLLGLRLPVSWTRSTNPTLGTKKAVLSLLNHRSGWFRNWDWSPLMSECPKRENTHTQTRAHLELFVRPQYTHTAGSTSN